MIDFDRFQNIKYCILHDWQLLPNAWSSDLDIVMPRHELRRFESALQQNADYCILHLVHYQPTGYCFTLLSHENGTRRIISFDIISDYSFNGTLFLVVDNLLEHRIKNGNFYAAVSFIELKYLTTKRILKLDFPLRKRERITYLANRTGKSGENALIELLGTRKGRWVLDRFKDGNWSDLENSIHSLKKTIIFRSIIKHPLRQARFWIADIVRIINRMRVPTGLFVTILGTDGTGKTTLAQGIAGSNSSVFRRVSITHFMHPFLFSDKKSPNIIIPHLHPNRSLLVSIAKVFYYFSNNICCYLIRIRPQLNRTSLVIYDRYFYDLRIDPFRYRYGGPQALIKLLNLLIPKPDIIFVLDLLPDLTIERKNELTHSELIRQSKEYIEFATEMNNAFILDARLSAEHVKRHAEEIIFSWLHRRYLKRRLNWFPFQKGDVMDSIKKILKVEISFDLKDKTHAYLGFSDGRGYFLSLSSRETFLKGLELYRPSRKRAILAKRLLQIYTKFSKSYPFISKVNLKFPSGQHALSIVQVLYDIFQRTDLTVSISLGTPGLYKKPVLQVITTSGTIMGYIKVGFDEVTKGLVKNEANMLKELAYHSPDFHFPRILFSGELEGNYYCVQSSQIIKEQKVQKYSEHSYIKIIKSLIKIFNDVMLLEESIFWQRILLRIQSTKEQYWKHILNEAADYVRNQMKERPLLFHLCHGDFAPWNIQFINSNPYIYDWDQSSKAAPAGYDLFHFLTRTFWLLEKKKPHIIYKNVLQKVQKYDIKEYGFEDEHPLRMYYLLYLVDQLAFLSSIERNPSNERLLYSKLIRLALN